MSLNAKAIFFAVLTSRVSLHVTIIFNLHLRISEQVVLSISNAKVTTCAALRKADWI